MRWPGIEPSRQGWNVLHFFVTDLAAPAIPRTPKKLSGTPVERALYRGAPHRGVAAADVDHALEPFALQDRGGEAAALAGLADRRDRRIARQLVEALAQLGKGDVDRAGNVPLFVLDRIAHVEYPGRIAVV